MTRVAGIVLAGGESSRMGSPKAWLPFGGETLLTRVVRLVARSADPVIVVGAPGQDLPQLPPGVRVVRDAPGGQGPLGGFAAGLSALADSVEFAYLTCTDAPFLADGWIVELARRINGNDLAIVRADGRLQPLAALYRVGPTKRVVRDRLDSGRARLSDLSIDLEAVLIEGFEMTTIDPLLHTTQNLNTPGDYRLAVERSRSDGPSRS